MAADTRERRVVVWGAGIVVVALLLARGVVPFASEARAREMRIATLRDQAARLDTLQARATSLAAGADSAERALAGAPRRVLRAVSPALAANALQRFVEDAATAAGLVVSRIEGTAGDAAYATVSVNAVGDVHGLAALLQTLADGPRVASVVRLGVTQTTALRGADEVLQLALEIRAPVITPGGATEGAGDASLAALATAAAAAPRAASADVEAAVRTLVTGHPFSPTRRAPRTRFVAPGNEPVAPGLAPAELSGPPEVAVAAGPQLLGVLLVDGRPRALLQVDGDSTARLVEEGARVGPWQVGPITRTSVTLRSAAGRRVVRLSRPSTDSSPSRP